MPSFHKRFILHTLIPKEIWPVFLFVSEVWARNCDKNSDVEFLKLLVLIDLFITNMKMCFVQRNHLLKTIYIQLLVKKKWDTYKKMVFDFFFNFKLFCVFLVKLLNII